MGTRNGEEGWGRGVVRSGVVGEAGVVSSPARRARVVGAVLLGLAVGGTAACDVSPDPTPGATSTPGPGPASLTGLPTATDEPQDVLTDLTTPWSLAFLADGTALLTQRDTAEVLLVGDGAVRPLTGPGAEELATGTLAEGEGGLLGVAVPPTHEEDGLVVLYRTTTEGNEVVRAVLGPDGSLGGLETVLTGIPSAGNHNGGRLAFGPDGYLYVATGDAGDREAAQDMDSLAGKILRVTVDGDPAPGNPVEGSPVWSLGHRNVQGLGWDSGGRMFASEFGQDRLDELNLIEPGANYGWPLVEGTAGADGLTDPLVTWATSEASPSGLAVSDQGVHVAGLRGARLWTVPFEGDGFGEPHATLTGGLGRLRDVVLGPDGALWVLTSNTDGRGSPASGDDRVVRVAVP